MPITTGRDRIFRPARIAFVLMSLAAACGGADPDARTADWQENFDNLNRASEAGNHDQAIAIADAYLKRYPDNVDAHMMAGIALSEAARAASDSSRPARFEQAAQHYARVLDLSHARIRRLSANLALVRIYDKEGLNKPPDAMRYGRMLITDEPKDINSYKPLADLHKDARQYDDAVKLLTEAKTAMETTEDAWVSYGGMVNDLVALAPDFPHATGRALSADASAEIDKALTKYGRTERLLRTKGMLLKAQAQHEPDAARQRALEAESDRAFDEMVRVMK